jgi:predicted protein tyrosine phosphatase
MFDTQVIALSREEAQEFYSDEPYVVISLTDTDAQHPQLERSAMLKERLALHFDDIYPGSCTDLQGVARLCEMQQGDAERIASFVKRWWGEVATIVVHCHAGIS